VSCIRRAQGYTNSGHGRSDGLAHRDSRGLEVMEAEDIDPEIVWRHPLPVGNGQMPQTLQKKCRAVCVWNWYSVRESSPERRRNLLSWTLTISAFFLWQI